MELRRKILPRTLSDFLITSFALIIIPTVYYFELFVVVPKYSPEWGSWHLFHFTTGTFILFNLCSNYVAIILCDTSIRGRILPTTYAQNNFCSVCETIVPPRSWHCNICNICILKRDHHCSFTSCCIGHCNLRYFLVFVFYMFVATVYASYYNVFYLFDIIEFNGWNAVLRVIFPMAMLFVQYSITQLHLFIILVVLLGGIFTGILLYFHTRLMLSGMVSYERKHKQTLFDFGTIGNIEEVLGQKWYMVWLSPFIESKLPNDGIHWDLKNLNKTK